MLFVCLLVKSTRRSYLSCSFHTYTPTRAIQDLWYVTASCSLSQRALKETSTQLPSIEPYAEKREYVDLEELNVLADAERLLSCLTMKTQADLELDELRKKLLDLKEDKYEAMHALNRMTEKKKVLATRVEEQAKLLAGMRERFQEAESHFEATKHKNKIEINFLKAMLNRPKEDKECQV